MIDNNTFQSEVKNTLFKLTHEIKNPLAVCKGYMEMFDVSDKEKSYKYLNIMKKEISRALMMMDDFLDFSKIKIEKDILDVYLLIEDVWDTLENLLKFNNVTGVFNVSSDELYINGDYNRLKQVLINVVKNSVEALSQNVFVFVEKHESNINIIVEEDGIGMNSNILNNLGNLFFTTKATGTGIGVNLSKEIIKMHDGNIIYYSEEGKGTKVIISLPLKKEMF